MLKLKLATFLSLLVLGQSVLAHPPGLSSAEIILDAQHTPVTITFAMQDVEAFVDMDTDRDAEVTPTELEASKPAIANWVADSTRVSIDQQAVMPATPGEVTFDDKNNVQIRFQFAAPVTKQLQFEAKLLTKIAAGHKQYVTVKDQQGKTVMEKMLAQQDYLLSVNPPSAANSQTTPAESKTFTEFVMLGIEHILTGYDHLLFLFSLLVITHSFWPALKIITFFTLAHSITLGLASFNVIDLPSYIVEPLIAATIIYVAIENLWRGENVKGREWLTFFFGLIHGFGFASVLREMNIGDAEGGILLPLFSFNLGVELGQITVASIVLPLIWWLHRKSTVGHWLTPVGSVVTGLAGAYWLIERTLLS